MVMLLIIGSVVFSILIFVSKKNIRKALLAAIAAETVTWPVGLLLVSFGKIEYPVRLFPKAIESSFLHGYILNPSIYAIYYIHYPKQAKLIWRWVYTLLITAIPVSIEIMANKYTNLVHYKAWSGFYSWMLLIIFYFIIRKYLDWFLKNAPKQGVPRNEA
ncbi:MAG: hypothetical protein K0R31_966 [Clostridiales bacterium]|jgi:hypothetical protein|nr:hypothetical protein [Clostridiales bacterium]